MKEFKPEYYMPRFKCNTLGKCKIVKLRSMVESGYFTGAWQMKNMFSLVKIPNCSNRSRDIWMSLSPSEIESQEVACNFAYGKTVVMGLGLGFSVLNIAKNKMVEKVFVIESDKNVISLFKRSIILNDLPEKIIRKINIINSNAFLWRPNVAIDFLYIDIWLKLTPPFVFNQVCAIQRNIMARKVYFWGQEIFIASNLKKGKSLTLNVNLLIPESLKYYSILKIIKERLYLRRLYNNKNSRIIFR